MNVANQFSPFATSANSQALEASRVLAAKTLESGGVGRANAPRSPSRPASPAANVRSPREIVDRMEISEEARTLLEASEKSSGMDAADRMNAFGAGTEPASGTTPADGEPTDPEGVEGGGPEGDHVSPGGKDEDEGAIGNLAAVGAAGGGEAPSSVARFAIPGEEGGSLDTRVTAYGLTPQAVHEDVFVLDLFG